MSYEIHIKPFTEWTRRIDIQIAELGLTNVAIANIEFYLLLSKNSKFGFSCNWIGDEIGSLRNPKYSDVIARADAWHRLEHDAIASTKNDLTKFITEFQIYRAKAR